MRAGIAQINVVSGDLETNMGRAVRGIDDLSLLGAEVVVLPETCDLGWCCPNSVHLADSDYVLATLSNAARRHGVFVVAGFTRKLQHEVANASVLIDATGEILEIHHKFRELEFGLEIYRPGDKMPRAVETNLGRIAVPICADCLEKTTFDHLASQGVDYVLSPSAWAVPPVLHSEKAPYGDEWIEAYSYGHSLGISSLGVSNIGEVIGGLWHGYPVIGNSIAVTKKGDVIRAPYGIEAMTLLDL